MNTIVEWVLDLMDRIGGPGIALGIFLENVFPPIPSEVILPLAGFTAAQGRYSLVEAVRTTEPMLKSCSQFSIATWKACRRVARSAVIASCDQYR